MKRITSILIVILSILCMPSLSNACLNLADPESPPPAIALDKQNYTSYATTSDNKNYEICFTGSFSTDETIVVEVDNLKISGLNLKSSNSVALQLSGSNITLDNVTLTGSGSGTAVQVNGTNMSIKNSTLYNFAKGIDVLTGFAAQLSKNNYKNITSRENSVVISDVPVIPPISENYVGKHVAENDAKKADWIVGKIDPSFECQGTIEMYFAPNDTDLVVHPSALCEKPTKEHIDYNLDTNNDNKADTTIANGECAFKCKNFSELLSVDSTYSYTSPAGQTYDMIALKPFSDRPSVISTGLGGFVMPQTGSEADGPGGAGTIYVAGYTGNTEASDVGGLGNVPAGSGDPLIDPITGQPKAGSDSSNTEDNSEPKATTAPGDGGLVNQQAGSSGGGGCGGGSLMGAADPAQAKACYSFIVSLLGLVPIGWRRLRK